MNRFRTIIVSGLSTCLWMVTAPLTNAATYNITLHAHSAATHFLDNISDYERVFTGSLEIADSDLLPNSLILFRDLLAFNVVLRTPLQSSNFGLDNPELALPGDISSERSQGIRLDARGEPLVFDTPSTSAGDGARIRDAAPRPLSFFLRFIDRAEVPVRVQLADGSIVANTTSEPIVARLGDWDFRPAPGDPGPHWNGVYSISAIPEAEAGLLTLVGLAALGFLLARRPRVKFG